MEQGPNVRELDQMFYTVIFLMTLVCNNWSQLSWAGVDYWDDTGKRTITQEQMENKYIEEYIVEWKVINNDRQFFLIHT